MSQKMRLSVIVLSVALTGQAWAGVPQPPVVLYGTVTIDDVLMTAADNVNVIARVDGVAHPVGTYHLGDDPLAGDQYVLQIRVEWLYEGAVQSDNAAVVGQTAKVYVQQEDGPEYRAEEVEITSQGMLVALDLSVSPSAAPPPATVAYVACTDDQGCAPGETCAGGQCGMHNNRYLSIVPPDVDPGTELGVMVTVVDGPCADTVLYSGPVTDYPEKDTGQPLGWFTGAKLGATPAYGDMSATVDGMVHLFGEEIAPGTTYDVRMVKEGGGESDVLTVTTAQWGDVVRPIAGPDRPLQPDFSDIGAIVDKFQGLAHLKAQCQLQPEVPDPTKAVDFKDIGACVDAFKGDAYPYSCSASGS